MKRVKKFVKESGLYESTVQSIEVQKVIFRRNGGDNFQTFTTLKGLSKPAKYITDRRNDKRGEVKSAAADKIATSLVLWTSDKYGEIITTPLEVERIIKLFVEEAASKKYAPIGKYEIDEAVKMIIDSIIVK